ncbi:MAG: N-formylglutamate amidohydrolase [Polyangiaceae bacterium]
MLLEPGEPEPFTIHRADGASPFVLTCDHASRTIPRALGDLGLDEAALSSHIAWDLGAYDAARALSDALDAPLVASGYSRLVIDANRPLEVAASIPAVTCDIPVPGNASLREVDRRARQDACFWPYHRAIERVLAARDARDQESVILAVHSFTPSLYGKDRPWHVGLLFGVDRRLADAFNEALAGATLAPGEPLVVGMNEPYFISPGTDYGVPTYAERAGRLGLLLELRQDLLTGPSTLGGARSAGGEPSLLKKVIEIVLAACPRVLELTRRG